MKLPDTHIRIVNIAGYISESARELYHNVLEAGRIMIEYETPFEKISTANELEDFGFVFRSTLPVGYELLPTPFEILLPSLAHRINWGYPPFAQLAANQKREIQDILLTIVKQKPDSIPVFLSTATAPRNIEGMTNIDSFVVQLLKHSKEVRAISAAEWSSNLPLVWSAITQRMQDGMIYRRIVSPFTLAAFGWNINWRDMAEIGIDIRVSTNRNQSPFYLFTSDGVVSALVFGTPHSIDAQPRATYTALDQLTQRLSEMFEDIWDSSIAARLLLEMLQNYKSDYTAKAIDLYGEIGGRVANQLFDQGIFSSFDEEEQKVLQEFLAAGLSVKSHFPIGVVDHVPNIISVIETYMQQERGLDE